MGLSRLRVMETGSLLMTTFCRPDCLNSRKSGESVDSGGAPINIMALCGALMGLAALGINGNLLAVVYEGGRSIWVDSLAVGQTEGHSMSSLSQ